MKLGYRYFPSEIADVTRKHFEKCVRPKNAYKMRNISDALGLSGLKDIASDYIKGYVI